MTRDPENRSTRSRSDTRRPADPAAPPGGQSPAGPPGMPDAEALAALERAWSEANAALPGHRDAVLSLRRQGSSSEDEERRLRSTLNTIRDLERQLMTVRIRLRKGGGGRQEPGPTA